MPGIVSLDASEKKIGELRQEIIDTVGAMSPMQVLKFHKVMRTFTLLRKFGNGFDLSEDESKELEGLINAYMES